MEWKPSVGFIVKTAVSVIVIVAVFNAVGLTGLITDPVNTIKAKLGIA